ncbi:MAG: TM1266 family iron-only hydrogenase system putative regulator [Bacteroidales bacterium]|jgi:putative iron-only hydrogenase system regulator|nr:CopG family transcriptional regulator [Bacteroidales bacterium]
MEKKLGAILIVIQDRSAVKKLQEILTQYASIIKSRQGINIQEEGYNVITLVVQGDNDTLNALTGKLGRISGLKAKIISLNIKKEEI